MMMMMKGVEFARTGSSSTSYIFLLFGKIRGKAEDAEDDAEDDDDDDAEDDDDARLISSSLRRSRRTRLRSADSWYSSSSRAAEDAAGGGMLDEEEEDTSCSRDAKNSSNGLGPGVDSAGCLRRSFSNFAWATRGEQLGLGRAARLVEGSFPASSHVLGHPCPRKGCAVRSLC